MLTNFKKELMKARQFKYAVPAFNFDNLDMLKAIIEGAEEENSPVIVMATESAANFMGFEYVTALMHTAIKFAKVPVIAHWDHGFKIDLIKKAILNNYSSVMLDASTASLKQNISQTQEIVELARKHNVCVESEIGHVGGKEDDRNTSSKRFTDPSEAKYFYNATKVDALAIAVGTAHGIYAHSVALRIDLIEQINKENDVLLVLHGSSGVPADQLKAAIVAGICKVNIGTDLKIANAQAIRKWLNDNPSGYDARKFGRVGIDAIKKVVKEKIRILNSNNKGN